MSVAAFIPNVFDRSRFGGEHQRHVTFIDDASELAELSPDLVIVDLDRCPEPASFLAITGDDQARSYRTVGFGPHVEAEAHDRAREMGYDEVLPRSKFFRLLPDLLADVNHEPEGSPDEP